MFRGNGLNSFDNGHATLPAITGFGIGLGVAAGFTWGDVDSGLYLRLGGGMDAVLGFEPFTLAGNIWVAGELRLWIVSIGADASLTVVVAEQPPTTPGGSGELSLWVHGQACGHVSFLFFSVSGCVTITISGPEAPQPDPRPRRQGVAAVALAGAGAGHRRRPRASTPRSPRPWPPRRCRR